MEYWIASLMSFVCLHPSTMHKNVDVVAERWAAKYSLHSSRQAFLHHSMVNNVDISGQLSGNVYVYLH